MDIIIFSDPEAGLRSASEETDVIILDLALAENGPELCRKFRTDIRTRDIPLLALSENPLDEDKLGDILSAGAMDVLSPPFSPPLLLARVNNMVLIHQEEILLKETENRYRRIFSSSHYGYFLSTREGRFLEVNDALLNILGYSRGEALNLKLPEDLYVNPEERDVLQTLIEKKGFVKDFKVDFKRKDGSTITILLTANLYRSLDGKIVGYEGINIPLTDLVPSRSMRLLNGILKPFNRFIRKRKKFLSVSRVAELVANQYEKLEELSQSYYSSVWTGRDVLGFEEAPLVIKISKSEAINSRLLLEARTLRKLTGHRGVPEFVDIARHKGRTVLITRYVEGKSLSELLPVTDREFQDRITYQLMDVTAHLHIHNIVHRDIKPDNIVVRPDGMLVLLDYGIVKSMTSEETSSTIIGTRPYMSPEQVNGESERRSDIWALGVVLYEIYTGRLPFSGNTELELMNNILHVEAPIPRSLNHEIPAQMENILITALRKKPEGRFMDAGQMRDEVLDKVPLFRKNVAELLEG
jgi:PAS domain S-box-containing protein